MVQIPHGHGVSRPRWFLELVDGNRITDVGNYGTEAEAQIAKRDWPQRSPEQAPLLRGEVMLHGDCTVDATDHPDTSI